MELDGHDFLDFGASKGGCIDFAVQNLGGRKGLGVDIDPKKVARMRALGYDCIEGDITKLDLPANSVRFVTMSHVLEHLPDLDAVGRAIKSAARVASDFLFIQGPYFDADAALARYGLKFYWSDWHGHPCHLTTSQLGGLLHAERLRHYVLMARVRVFDSEDPSIHPLSSPQDQHDYSAAVHPPKPMVVFDPPAFDRPLYREMVCVVKLRPFGGWEEVLRARRGCDRVTDLEKPRPNVGLRLTTLLRAVRGLDPRDTQPVPPHARHHHIRHTNTAAAFHRWLHLLTVGTPSLPNSH